MKKSVKCLKRSTCNRLLSKICSNSTFPNVAEINTNQLKSKTTKVSSNEELDKAVFIWFQQIRDRGDSISGPILKEKAILLSKQLDPNSTFKASEGWMHRFKKRHGIKYCEMKGEKLSNNPENANEFALYLQERIDREKLSLDNIYNADETGMFWRSLPSKTLAFNTETEVSGRKEHKERVTALFCSNASGNHQIPLLVIGKSCTPRCLKSLINPEMKNSRLKNLDSLGVIYTHQNNSWMNKEIFMLWYKEIFIPNVLNHQKETGVTGIVTLLLDNAPAHPSLSELNAVNENFKVQFLPPNVTAIIQPMDQVWRAILGDELINDQPDSDIEAFNNNEEVETSTNSTEESSNFLEQFGDTIVNFFQNESNFSVIESRKHLLTWLNNEEKNDSGWELMSDENIISFVTAGKVVPTSVNEIEEANESTVNLEKENILPSQVLESLRIVETNTKCS
ncbi:tigger transposable element-derived protein 2-like [Leptopilina heterotoma]|uniref:tigger transposable element-derived protein 2-like n=1 Tax=Leptopilina heterotoma TaxID=63436 RepID=UPI001CA955EA|nr:tigger transposable element-derived protein 2-like [Leptopilina heterotoma]